MTIVPATGPAPTAAPGTQPQAGATQPGTGDAFAAILDGITTSQATPATSFANPAQPLTGLFTATTAQPLTTPSTATPRPATGTNPDQDGDTETADPTAATTPNGDTTNPVAPVSDTADSTANTDRDDTAAAGGLTLTGLPVQVPVLPVEQPAPAQNGGGKDGIPALNMQPKTSAPDFRGTAGPATPAAPTPVFGTQPGKVIPGTVPGTVETQPTGTAVANGGPVFTASPATRTPVKPTVAAPIDGGLTTQPTPIPAAASPLQMTPVAQATAPAPTQQAAPADFQSQLSKPVFSLVASGDGEHTVTVRVTPENLGPVTVRAHVTGQNVHIELFSPSDAGRDAIRQIMPDLRRDLAGTGLSANLDLSSRSQPDSGFTGERQDQQQTGTDPFTDTPRRASTVPTVTALPHVPTRGSASSLDVIA